MPSLSGQGQRTLSRKTTTVSRRSCHEVRSFGDIPKATTPPPMARSLSDTLLSDPKSSGESVSGGFKPFTLPIEQRDGSISEVPVNSKEEAERVFKDRYLDYMEDFESELSDVMAGRYKIISGRPTACICHDYTARTFAFTSDEFKKRHKVIYVEKDIPPSSSLGEPTRLIAHSGVLDTETNEVAQTLPEFDEYKCSYDDFASIWHDDSKVSENSELAVVEWADFLKIVKEGYDTRFATRPYLPEHEYPLTGTFRSPLLIAEEEPVIEGEEDASLS